MCAASVDGDPATSQVERRHNDRSTYMKKKNEVREYVAKREVMDRRSRKHVHTYVRRYLEWHITFAKENAIVGRHGV